MTTLYTIETRKEALKFSAAHVATFADGSVEKLHGHNYQVVARISGKLDQAGMVLDVGLLKQWVRVLCDELDESVLIAARNPEIKVEENQNALIIKVKEKTYQLPREDCKLLPIENTTMEFLAQYLAQRLKEKVLSEKKHAPRMQSLTVEVSESPGQSAGWTLDLATE